MNFFLDQGVVLGSQRGLRAS